MAVIDFTSYVRPPRLGAAGGVVLGIRIINAAPPDLSPSAKKALKRVREGTVRVQAVGKERDRLRPESLRPLDQRLDSAWGAVQARIQSWARADLPEGKDAQALLETLSLGSLDFLSIDLESEWVESNKRLERIDEEGHARLVEKLAGAPFLAAVRSAHRDLGEALGVGTGTREVASSTALAEAIRQLAEAIAHYGRTLSAEVDVDDDASVRRFLAAMAPLDAHRIEGRVERNDGEPAPVEPPVDPNGPVPPVA